MPIDLPPEQREWFTNRPPWTFRVLPRRWVVERTFAWLLRSQRPAADYERKVQTSEALIEVAMIRLLVARLGWQP